MDSRRPSPNKASRLRLQKFLAQCGVGSRRACESLISSGVVSVNGTAVSEQGSTVDPAVDQVTVRGERVALDAPVYYLANKPRDVICTSKDPQGRRTILDLLPEQCGRVYAVGRLDRDSEGLILLTNDGALSERLTHPRYHVEKRYRVRIGRDVQDRDIARMKHGIESDGDVLTAADVRRLPGQQTPTIEIVLKEGKNRQIRRMMEALRIPIRSLRRTHFGPLRLKGLRSGQCRALTAAELKTLRKAAGLRVDARS